MYRFELEFDVDKQILFIFCIGGHLVRQSGTFCAISVERFVIYICVKSFLILYTCFCKATFDRITSKICDSIACDILSEKV